MVKRYLSNYSFKPIWSKKTYQPCVDACGHPSSSHSFYQNCITPGKEKNLENKRTLSSFPPHSGGDETIHENPLVCFLYFFKSFLLFFKFNRNELPSHECICFVFPLLLNVSSSSVSPPPPSLQLGIKHFLLKPLDE